MKKAISMKPLALATAFAAGSTVSMIATALPGGDTLGAAGVVNESICQQSVDMTISGGSRSVTTGIGTCQLRTLPPTKGFVRTESSPAGGTVSDSSAMVSAGGELYEAYVGGNRDAAVLLTPNRAFATSRSIAFAAGADGSMTYDFAASVQPSTGLQSSWLTGTYTIVNRQHNFSQIAAGLEKSIYANPNLALGERNYTKAMNVTFNGDGTCAINDIDSHVSGSLTMDPLMNIDGTNQMDVDCTVGGGSCGQNDGRNYVAMGVINLGSTATMISDEEDWQDASGDNNGAIFDSCTYSTAAGKVTVNYGIKWGNMLDIPSMTLNNWTVTYDVSSDLRYLVSDGDSLTDLINSGDGGLQKGGLAVGVRTNGSTSLTGKTYLFNSLDATLAASTPATASYENPSQPIYQEEECISRGSLSLAAAGACTVNVVSTCTGRSRSGYEETTAGGADGTISDSLTVFDGTPLTAPTCSWSGTASNLTVNLGIQDPDGNPVTKVYTGSASDNGEALVLQGIYNVAGSTPDVDNPPLLPQQKFNMLSMLVAQEYQGTLTADADSDTATNFDEFVWALDNTQVGSVRSDFDNDGDTDVLMRSASAGTWRLFNVQANAVTGNAFFNIFSNADTTYVAQLDADGDGDVDVLTRSASTGAWRVFTVANGAVTGSSSLGLYASSAWNFAAIADLDADGDDDVLLRNGSNGQWQAFYLNAGAVSGSAYFTAYTNTDWVIQSALDADGDGDDDLIMRRTSTGEWRLFSVAAGNVSGSSYFNMYTNADWTMQRSADLDGDADGDVILRRTSTGEWRNFTLQSGAVTGSAYFNMFVNSAWTVAAVGDFAPDANEDVVLRNGTTGEYRLFSVNAGATTGSSYFNLFTSSDYSVKQ